MANTNVVYARIDANLKEQAEVILHRLGITPTSAVQMLYSQIVMQKGMPFDLKIPIEKPIAIGSLTYEELMAELQKGRDSIREEGGILIEELKQEYACSTENNGDSI